MNLSQIKYLQREAENEALSLEEIVEIETAFKKIDPSTLRDLPENALASDMLEELEDRVSTVEKTIYNWVESNFGESEANEPSWNIEALAEEINDIPVGMGAEEFTLGKLLSGEL